ncbi:hypothetical protein BO94DRAFT_552276 [Aspergillus sclerotioniger CBS 115572]|uniref:BTB domain-containing protein n=1 Tax=Aspergillus sclerotioniger CBS 115572 TaxID=1450535 RepID=A0A317XDU3_9EURO|nr:hypothetical protein BO94DRAFT_552276 [Aspergillus sclerotioniger CBS 115572]PWY96714.1 hypothetical protein BO94DRAFT_552276 [Aspergillus sclerotioniger CBS 115572]
MDSDFGKHISSSLFTFIVGQEKKEIVVHSAPLASLSPALDKLMNGTMLEAKLHQVDWSAVVEEDTFVRLCEFAYVGDYTPPSCSDDEAAPVPTPTCNSEAPGTYLAPTVSASLLGPQNPEADLETPETPETQPERSRKKRKGKRFYSSVVPASETKQIPYEDDNAPAEETSESVELVEAAQPSFFAGYTLPYREKSIWSGHLRDKFASLSVRFTQSHDDFLSRQKAKFAPRRNSHPQEDFTPVFLGHANLYILADTYGILPLTDLVLYKLATTLTEFRVCEDNVSDMAELVRCSYRGTRPHDTLRMLVTTYIVSVLGQIGENDDFQELLAEGGDFVMDFWQAVWA